MAEEPGRESSPTEGARAEGVSDGPGGTATLASNGAGPALPAATVPLGAAPAPVPEEVAARQVATEQEAHETPRLSRRDRRHRSRRRLVWSLGVVSVVVVLVAAGWVAAQRINRPLPHPGVQAGLPISLVVSGAPPPLAWPGRGQAAISVPAFGYAAQSGPEPSVPIASLTKMTNALVVLQDHPVAAGSGGGTVTITPGDVAEYDNELHNDQSTVPIQLGETLTERQMLEALLTQSANDIAYALAVWDAGTEPAFVAKMNAAAASVGADSTHFVDASGYDPHSVSTAADCLRIAAAGMANPTFAAVVGMTTISIPLVGTVHNLVTEIGSNGVVGVKSGYTSYAGGCMVLAADRVVDGRTVLVLAAVLGQPVPPPIVPTTTTTTAPPAPPPTTPPTTAPTTTTTTTVPPASGAAPAPTPPPATAPAPTAPPPTAPPTTAPPRPSTPTTTIPLNDLTVPDPFRYTRPAVEGLLSSAEAGVVRLPLTSSGQPAGAVTAVWGGHPHRVAVVASGQAWLLGWPGQRATATTRVEPVAPGGRGGTQVGTTTYRLGAQVESVTLRLASTIPEPTWWWRLVHN